MRTFSEIDELFKRSVNEILLNVCKEKYEPDGDWLSPDHICAENYFDNDICKGSAGGFLGTSEGNFHVVHGISSTGPSICGIKTPTVFTRIASYTDWIEGIVWPKAESLQGNVASGNQNGYDTYDVQDTTRISVAPHEDRIIFRD